MSPFTYPFHPFSDLPAFQFSHPFYQLPPSILCPIHSVLPPSIFYPTISHPSRHPSFYLTIYLLSSYQATLSTMLLSVHIPLSNHLSSHPFMFPYSHLCFHLSLSNHLSTCYLSPLPSSWTNTPTPLVSSHVFIYRPTVSTLGSIKLLSFVLTFLYKGIVHSWRCYISRSSKPPLRVTLF